MADRQNTHNSESAANKRSTTAGDFPAGALSRTGGDGKTGAATARSLYDQAKETAGQAYDAVTDQAANKLDEQKSSLSGGLTTVADSVRQVSDNLVSSKTESGLAEAAAKYTGTAAQKIEDVAGYFESRSVREMARDVEDFARRNPAIFIGAAFGLGLLAARFLKSTSPRYDEAGKGREFAASAGSDGPLKVPSKGAAIDPNFSNGPM